MVPTKLAEVEETKILKSTEALPLKYKVIFTTDFAIQMIMISAIERKLLKFRASKNSLRVIID